MHAYQLQKSNKVPVSVELPTPVPGPGEVLVRTRAVSIHPVDIETRDGGNAMLLPMKRPFVGGVDLAGEVAALGPGVADLAVGDAVIGYRGVATQGAFATEQVVPRSHLGRAPDGRGIEEQACLPLPALCALQASSVLSGPARVLVHGGAGGVGSVAVQLLSALGHQVIATAAGRDAERVRGYGAREVIDYQQERFEERVSGLDLVFDTVGKDTLKRSFGVIREGGRVVSLTAIPEPAVLRAAGFSVPTALGWLLSMMGAGLRRRARRVGGALVAQVTVPDGAALDRAARLVEREGLSLTIAKSFPWADLPAALDHAATRPPGRVVVVV